MYQFGHCVEGLLPHHEIRTIKLANVLDELGGRFNELRDERGRSSFFV